MIFSEISSCMSLWASAYHRLRNSALYCIVGTCGWYLTCASSYPAIHSNHPIRLFRFSSSITVMLFNLSPSFFIIIIFQRRRTIEPSTRIGQDRTGEDGRDTRTLEIRARDSITSSSPPRQVKVTAAAAAAAVALQPDARVRIVPYSSSACTLSTPRRPCRRRSHGERIGTPSAVQRSNSNYTKEKKTWQSQGTVMRLILIL